MNLIFRCFYGIPLLHAQRFPTNAILGTVKILSKIIHREIPEYVAFFLDKGRDPRRQNLLPEYKANRLETPDPVKVQIPVVKEFAYALGCAVIERTGVEADDLMASFARKYGNDFDNIYIFSADKDLAQCVRGNVEQIIPDSDKESIGCYLSAPNVLEKFGVLPEQIVDYLSLMGDQADNIPGIYGVGPKKASHWLREWGSLENIFAHIEKIKPERFQNLLLAGREILERNRQIIKLNDQIENIYLEKCEFNSENYDRLVDFYQLASLKRMQAKKQWVQEDLFSF
jgi:DNA polymerase-1